MPNPEKRNHPLSSVANHRCLELEQRPGSEEIGEHTDVSDISQAGAEEPEEKSEAGPGLKTAEPVGRISLPDEAKIIAKRLPPYLTASELNAFMATNHFFANNNRLCQARLDAGRSLKMVAGSHSTLRFSVFGPLIQWGGVYNESGFIEHSINLASGEWIREAVARANFNLLLTNRRMLMNGYCSFIPLCRLAFRAEDFNECLIDLEPGEGIIKIAASNAHCVLLSSAKQVLVSGFNNYGQLGLANQPIQKGFKKLELALLNNEWVVDVAVSESHTLLRTNKDRVFASGCNEDGQLGLSHQNKVCHFELCSLADVLHAKEGIKSMAVGNHHSVLLTTSNRILVSGNNACGQLGLDQSVRCSTSFTECIIADLKPGESIERVVTGGVHTVVLTNHHRLFVCGENMSGQLGLQSIGHHYQFTECLIGCLQANEVIIDVTVGSAHTLLTTNQERVLASGYNHHRQLGLGHGNNAPTFQKSLIPTHNKPSGPLEPDEVGPSVRSKTEPAEDSNSGCVMQ